MMQQDSHDISYPEHQVSNHATSIIYSIAALTRCQLMSLDLTLDGCRHIRGINCLEFHKLLSKLILLSCFPLFSFRVLNQVPRSGFKRASFDDWRYFNAQLVVNKQGWVARVKFFFLTTEIESESSRPLEKHWMGKHRKFPSCAACGKTGSISTEWV